MVAKKESLKKTEKNQTGAGIKINTEFNVGAKKARTKIPQEQRWKLVFTIIMMLIWVAASVIVSQLIVGYLMLWIVGSETFQTPLVTTIYSALSYVLALILIVFMPMRMSANIKKSKEPNSTTKTKKKETKLVMRKELGLTGWPTWTDVGLAPVGFIVYIILAAGVTALFTYLSSCGIFPWFDAEQAQDVGYNVLNGRFDRVVAFIALVIIAPIVEEIIFRGWLYGKLRQKLSGQITEVAGIILSIFLVSLLFGLLHMQWNVGVSVFALSVVLCGLREITGTIYAGMLVHMLKNGVAFYLLYVLNIT